LNGVSGQFAEYNAAIMKLLQKQFLKGSREFEITDDSVNVRIRSGLREEKLSVSLAVLNPEPVVNAPFLEFHSRVKCGPLLALLLDRPNAREFNAFVDNLKRRAREEYHAFVGLGVGSVPPTVAPQPGNRGVDGIDSIEPAPRKRLKNRSAERIDEAAEMLQLYLGGAEIEPLLSALAALKNEPQSEVGLARLVQAFDDLGPRQGAVLTYAPFVGILLTEDPFEL